MSESLEQPELEGMPEPEQKDWIADLQASGIDVRIWKPKDEDEIQIVLAREAA